MLYAVIAIVVFILLFIWWRWTSVGRGARQRDETILAQLDPVASKLEEQQSVSADEVKVLADQPQIRPLLHTMLSHYKRLDLYPDVYLDQASQAEAVLAYWLMHPNELQAPPDEIEQVAVVDRNIDGQDTRFYVFRFRQQPPHWAAKDGWMLGLAGPYFADDPPYGGVAGAFSKFLKDGEESPTQFVQWYIDMMRRKSS